MYYGQRGAAEGHPGFGEAEKEKKMDLNIMEEMREALTIKGDARMLEEMRMREDMKMKEDMKIREEIEAREDLKLNEETRLREELKIKEDMRVQQMKLEGYMKGEMGGSDRADENQNTTLANPLRQGSLILEDDNIPLIDVCISSEEEEEEEEVEEVEDVAPLPGPELDPWRPKSASLSLRQNGGDGVVRGGRNRGSISSLGIGPQEGLGMALLAKNPNMVNSPDIFHLRWGHNLLFFESQPIFYSVAGLRWSPVRISYLPLCPGKPFLSLCSPSRIPKTAPPWKD